MTTKQRIVTPMTPDKYLQTDEECLLEIAPHWRLLNVMQREARELGLNCGMMFYIGTELEGRISGAPDKAAFLYRGACLEETALALSALIPLMPGAKLVVMTMTNTKSTGHHQVEVIWRAADSNDMIRKIRENDELEWLMNTVSLDTTSAGTSPYFVLNYAIPSKRGMAQAQYGFKTFNPYGVAIELLLRGQDVGAIVRVMKWGEKKSVYRRNKFMKFASEKFRSRASSVKETVMDVRSRMYSKQSLVGEFGAW